jgi:2'-5' RNA ligase superfamily
VESSIDVLVLEAASLLDQWYGMTQAAIDGMPPHITLLWPWLDAPVPEVGIDRARRALAGLKSFRLTFLSCGRFPGVVYLVPEPRDPLDRLVERLVVAFPETPPFGGEFGSAPCRT